MFLPHQSCPCRFPLPKGVHIHIRKFSNQPVVLVLCDFFVWRLLIRVVISGNKAQTNSVLLIAVQPLCHLMQFWPVAIIVTEGFVSVYSFLNASQFSSCFCTTFLGLLHLPATSQGTRISVLASPILVQKEYQKPGQSWQWSSSLYLEDGEMAGSDQIPDRIKHRVAIFTSCRCAAMPNFAHFLFSR